MTSPTIDTPKTDTAPASTPEPTQHAEAPAEQAQLTTTDPAAPPIAEVAELEPELLASQPIPGYAYLRIPAGNPTTPGECSFLDRAIPEAESAEENSATHNVDALTLRRWIMVWLEAKEGRRAPQGLKKGPYSPAVVDALQRSTPPRRAGSKVGSLQLQATRSGKIRFSASVYYDGRVRALAGVLDDGKGPRSTQYPPRTRAELRVGLWRVEHLHMV